ncbi:MAG TPA: hypothetical protein VNF73_02985 [Candidatus Saccharimonadales bacterium]|nr:hypothetical protein [Candidatus Saccharimonadales bacterium]
MATGTIVHSSAPAVAAPRNGVAGRIAIAGLLILGMGALAGGIALASKPDGSVMMFDVSLLAGSPFADYFWPGLILGGLFGVGSLAVAVLGLRHSLLAPFLAFAIGCAQMIWIVVELAIIREFSFLHPTMFAIGAVIALASVRWGWPTFQGWRSGR